MKKVKGLELIEMEDTETCCGFGGTFAAKFKDPFLRMAIRSYVDAPGWPMLDFPLAVLSGFMKVGVTEGGVLGKGIVECGNILHLNSITSIATDYVTLTQRIAADDIILRAITNVDAAITVA